MDYLYLVGGLVLLILGGDWLLKGAISLSVRINIPKAIIGMTVVSFATSAPELIVSIKSALQGHADIALGNVVGSNIANLGFVLGITLLMTKMEVGRSFVRIDWPILMLVSVLLYACLYFDGELQFYEGLLFFSLLIIYLVLYLKVFKYSKIYKEDHLEEEEIDEVSDSPSLSVASTLLFLFMGALGLYFGSEFLIEGSVNLASSFGVSERVIGITVISVGTSIPELAASIIAAIKKERAISLGNLIGSNIFNILAVLGVTSMITPIRVSDDRLLTNDLFWMLGFAIVLLPLIYMFTRRELRWKEGLFLLIGYVVFILSTIQ